MSGIAVGGASGPQSVNALIQENWLEGAFRDALYPILNWRRDCPVEMWEQNRGEEMLLTRTGLIEPDTDDITPGQDPTAGSYSTEQWRVRAAQKGKTLDVSMPTSFVAQRSLLMENTKKLGMNAGQTMNRTIRDRIMTAYLSGQTTTVGAAAIGLTQIAVASVSGFAEQLQNGKLLPVSGTNPIAVTFAGSEAANEVVAVTPADPSAANGVGLLTLRNALTAGLAAREGVFSANAAVRRRAGGAATVDGITATSLLTVADIQAAVTRLRRMNVPKFPDGKYRVLVDPVGLQQLYQDTAWRQLQQSLPDGDYKDFVVGTFSDCVFISDNELPNLDTVPNGSLQDTGALAKGSPQIGGDIVNATGVPIGRALVYGMEITREFRIPESSFMTQAGVTGVTGQMSGIANGNYSVNTEGIRYIYRAPLDRLQQVVSLSWSWSGDFGVPSDQTNGDAARFKRGVVIEHVGA